MDMFEKIAFALIWAGIFIVVNLILLEGWKREKTLFYAIFRNVGLVTSATGYIVIIVALIKA